jgi:hypothetical protein
VEGGKPAIKGYLPRSLYYITLILQKINRRLLGPQAFLLERLMGIFHAITPYQVPSSADIQAQVRYNKN